MNKSTNEAQANRFAALEEAIAHHEAVVDDLNTIVARQDNEIKALTKRLDALIERFLVVEEHARPDVPVDKPPHW